MYFKIRFYSRSGYLLHICGRAPGINDLNKIMIAYPSATMETIKEYIQPISKMSVEIVFNSLEMIREFRHVFIERGHIDIAIEANAFNIFVYEKCFLRCGTYGIENRFEEKRILPRWITDGCPTEYWNPKGRASIFDRIFKII